VFSKTTTSLISTYLIIVVLFAVPVAAAFFADVFYSGTSGADAVRQLGMLSPISATFSLPLEIRSADSAGIQAAGGLGSGGWDLFFGHVGWSVIYNGLLLGAMMWLFQVRWRVAE
jgi:hypothetical protein